ncbi:MAG: hypothetical protein NTX52_05355, partial [Planctomycetota bacterium]|nr:hypothetical protein [Planctomycetota bacterium]
RLLGLVSDIDREVRLKTAQILAKMSAMDPAEKLIGQFRAEKDPEVRLAIFEALGEACFFAFSPGSPIKLSGDIRSETLDLAGKYLVEVDVQKAQKGAEVIRKLLELNGMEKEQTQKYLELLHRRYEQSISETGVLRAALLQVMARLCSQTSNCRVSAAKLYIGAFTEGLDAADNNAVRESAVSGLVNVDKVEALRLFRERRLYEDGSTAIRRAVMDLVAQNGGTEDIEWLAGRLNLNGDAELVWQTMRQVLSRQGAVLIADWANRLAGTEPNSERVRELLDIAEKKAQAEQKADVVLSVRQKLLELYVQKGDYTKVEAYCRLLLKDPAIGEDGERIGLLLLEACLHLGDWNGVRQLAAKRLETVGDLGADDPMVVKIEAYLFQPNTETDAKTQLLSAIAGIKVNDTQKPKWAAKVKMWHEKLADAVPKTPSISPAAEPES